MTKSGNHIEIGKIGESIAESFLKKLGHTIITKNYRKPWGEIDIISKSPDKTLTFIEVKAIKSNKENPAISAGLTPEDNLTKSKLMKLKKICEEFANQNPSLINEKKGWQIDLVAINFSGEPILTEKDKNYVIKYYRNL